MRFAELVSKHPNTLRVCLFFYRDGMCNVEQVFVSKLHWPTELTQGVRSFEVCFESLIVVFPTFTICLAGLLDSTVSKSSQSQHHLSQSKQLFSCGLSLSICLVLRLYILLTQQVVKILERLAEIMILFLVWSSVTRLLIFFNGEKLQFCFLYSSQPSNRSISSVGSKSCAGNSLESSISSSDDSSGDMDSLSMLFSYFLKLLPISVISRFVSSGRGSSIFCLINSLVHFCLVELNDLSKSLLQDLSSREIEKCQDFLSLDSDEESFCSPQVRIVVESC